MPRRSPLHGLATRLGMGGLARRYYHEPLGHMRRSIREGGPLEQRRTELGRLAMVEAARDLPPLDVPAEGAPCDVAFLSGENYWYQTLFCIWSMQRQSGRLIRATIHDDGSFTDEAVAAILRVSPASKVVRRAELEDRLDRHLPVARFPTLRSRRLDYPHLRKLTDVHAGRNGWTMVLDSDMLFFRRPDAMLAWFDAPDRGCCMIDVEPSYGYSDALMLELAGTAVPELVNVGACALKSEEIDWDRVESWCRTMIEREGPNYVQEQALSALLLAGKPCLRLSKADYRVRPALAEGTEPTAVLHHYVAESKRSYFQHGWRRVLAEGRR